MIFKSIKWHWTKHNEADKLWNITEINFDISALYSMNYKEPTFDLYIYYEQKLDIFYNTTIPYLRYVPNITPPRSGIYVLVWYPGVHM